MKNSLRILSTATLFTAMGTLDVDAGHGHHHQKDNQSQNQKDAQSENQKDNQSQNQKPDKNSSNTKPQSSSSGSATNKYDIKVTYTGTHDVGQKLDGGKIVQDPGKAYGQIACGDIAPNELMGGKSPNAKVFEMPAKQHTITIPKGSIPVIEGEYYIVDEKGKFVRGSDGKYKTEKGLHAKCNYSFIGHGGFLGDFSADLTEIRIGESIEGNSFKYGK